MPQIVDECNEWRRRMVEGSDFNSPVGSRQLIHATLRLYWTLWYGCFVGLPGFPLHLAKSAAEGRALLVRRFQTSLSRFARHHLFLRWVRSVHFAQRSFDRICQCVRRIRLRRCVHQLFNASTTRRRYLRVQRLRRRVEVKRLRQFLWEWHQCAAELQWRQAALRWHDRYWQPTRSHRMLQLGWECFCQLLAQVVRLRELRIQIAWRGRVRWSDLTSTAGRQTAYRAWIFWRALAQQRRRAADIQATCRTKLARLTLGGWRALYVRTSRTQSLQRVIVANASARSLRKCFIGWRHLCDLMRNVTARTQVVISLHRRSLCTMVFAAWRSEVVLRARSQKSSLVALLEALSRQARDAEDLRLDESGICGETCVNHDLHQQGRHLPLRQQDTQAWLLWVNLINGLHRLVQDIACSRVEAATAREEAASLRSSLAAEQYAQTICRVEIGELQGRKSSEADNVRLDLLQNELEELNSEHLQLREAWHGSMQSLRADSIVGEEAMASCEELALSLQDSEQVCCRLASERRQEIAELEHCNSKHQSVLATLQGALQEQLDIAQLHEADLHHHRQRMELLCLSHDNAVAE